MRNQAVFSVAAALAMVSMATNAHAFIEWDLQPSGTGAFDWTMEQSIDYSLASDTSVNGGASIAFDGTDSSVNGHCLELETQPKVTVNPDTRIWVLDHGTYRSVNDDFGGTLQSKARLWLAMTTSGGNLDWVAQIAAFNAAHNSDNFYFKITRRDITESACTTGQTTIPWAKIKGTTGSYTVTLSPNAT